MPRDCPVCGLINPDTTDTCDCGYSFAHAGTLGRIQLGAHARRNMLIGALLCFAGLSVSILSLAAAPVTGVRLVAWGLILFGAAQFVRGCLQARGGRQFARKGQETEGPDERGP